MLPLNVEARHINHLSRHFERRCTREGGKRGVPVTGPLFIQYNPPSGFFPQHFPSSLHLQGKKIKIVLDV